jgi:hypothetical protein
LQEPISTDSPEFGKYLPSIVIGYTSGDNETLSLPFQISRSGYANDVAGAALGDSASMNLPDNRLMMIDYGTNLEVLFSNLMLGKQEIRDEILRDMLVFQILPLVAVSYVWLIRQRQKRR